MAVKFTNTEIVNTLDTLSEGIKDRLANPLYNFNNEKGTTVTYFNTDINNTPLDNATGLQYASIGDLANTVYNKIYDFVIYGLKPTSVTVSNGEFGSEADDITGDAIILPNTIHPYIGDFFIVNHNSTKCLFRIIDAQSDTFDNGANVWSISYKLEHYSDEELEKYNIGIEYRYILNNVGTNYNPVIRITIYDAIKKMDAIRDGMREYYISLFYNNRVQSLIGEANNNKFYDSFLTEFVSKNGLLEDRDEYMYIQHQIAVPDTFALDYSRTFFFCLEEKNKDKLARILNVSFGELITSKVNIFSTRPEQYLKMNYRSDIRNLSDSFAPGLIFEIFDKDLIYHIQENELFDSDVLSNLIVKYFNDEDITDEDLTELDLINYSNNIELFYYVPVAIFIIEKYIEKLLSKQSND